MKLRSDTSTISKILIDGKEKSFNNAKILYEPYGFGTEIIIEVDGNNEYVLMDSPEESLSSPLEYDYDRETESDILEFWDFGDRVQVKVFYTDDMIEGDE